MGLTCTVGKNSSNFFILKYNLSVLNCDSHSYYSKSGVTDYYAQDDTHAIHLARRIVKNLNRKKIAPVRIFFEIKK